MEFGYWSIKGIAEPIRYLMAYLNTDYQEVSPGNRQNWDKFKASVNKDQFPFPNLPYIKENNKYISESKAIVYFLCYKHKRLDLLGEDAQKKVEHQQLQDCIEFLRRGLFGLMRDQEASINYEKQVNEKFIKRLYYLSMYLGDKQFFQNSITYSDFQFHYVSQIFNDVSNSLKQQNPVNRYQNLKQHEQTMRELKGLKDYLENDPRRYFLYLPKHLLKFDINQQNLFTKLQNFQFKSSIISYSSGYPKYFQNKIIARLPGDIPSFNSQRFTTSESFKLTFCNSFGENRVLLDFSKKFINQKLTKQGSIILLSILILIL